MDRLIEEVGFARDSALEGDGFDLSVLSAYRNTPGFQPFLAREQKGFCPRFCPRRKAQKTQDGAEF